MTCPSTTGCDKDCYTCEYSDYSKQEIIRCRDCKYFEEGGSNYFACSRGESIYGYGTITEPDGFCAWAEKKDQ